MKSTLTHIFCSALLAAGVLRPGFASAQDFRMATVDLNRIINETKDAQEERQKLEALTTKKRKEIDAKKEGLQALEKKLVEKNAAKDSKEVEDLRSQAKDLGRLVKDTEEDLKKEYVKVTKGLMQEALEAISVYADRQKISLVIERSEGQRGPIIYGVKNLDITDEIIKQLNG